jgi:glutamine amidotransferase
MKVGIINYGVGNLGSVGGALSRIGVDYDLIDAPCDINNFDKLILPGVGNFDECSQRLEQGGWVDFLRQAGGEQKPILGICLGMQLLATSSHETLLKSSNQEANGLGLIKGTVRHLSNLDCNIRVPHVGWNEIIATQRGGEMFRDVPNTTDFYFVHSYAFFPDDKNDIAATTNYGAPFASAIRSGNIWGAQFHPEKSSKAGIKFLKNFIEFDLC